MLNNYFQTPKKETFKSNMVFSCGPGDKDKRLIPAQYWREDQYECTYYKMTAPVLVEMQPELAEKHGLEAYPVSSKRVLAKVTGPVVFIASGDDFWGGEKARNFRSKVYENPTYRSLMGAAKASQKVTRDLHHAFIENVHFKGYEEVGGRQVMVLRMSFGS